MRGRCWSDVQQNHNALFCYDSILSGCADEGPLTPNPRLHIALQINQQLQRRKTTSNGC